MRILVAPNTDEFMDRNSLWGLVWALRAAGHETFFPARPVDGYETAPLCKELKIDVFFQLNRGRPYDLPKDVRHIAWFQDQPHIPPDLADRVQSSDLVYRVVPRLDYEPDVNGRCFSGYLLLAMDELMLDAYVPPAEKSVDFSFCGTMTPPFDVGSRGAAVLGRWDTLVARIRAHLTRTELGRSRVGRQVIEAAISLLTSLVAPIRPTRKPPVDTTGFNRALLNTLELVNRPLIGDWQPDWLAQKMHQILMQHPATASQISRQPDMFMAYAIEGPRQMERFILIENILHVTDSVELYGVNWDTHPMFAPYHKGVVTGPQALFQVFGRSRLNGANTLRSILHRRTLECMGVGEFLFINASVSDLEPGGLRTYFEPGVHYGEYTPDNLREEALRWIRDEKARKEIGKRAAIAVREKHLWRHRAEQILTDLRIN